MLNVTVTGSEWRWTSSSGHTTGWCLSSEWHHPVGQSSRSHLEKFLLILNYMFFKTLQGWSSDSSSHSSAPRFHFKDVFLHPAWWHCCFSCGPILPENANSNNNESKLLFWAVCARFPVGDREPRKPCSNSVIVKLWHKRLFTRFCWVIQGGTGSQFLHVNFLKESTRHLFLEEMFATAYVKYYNIQALMSFIFSLLSLLIHSRPSPLPPSLIIASQQ